MGNYPDATAVFDIDAIGLVNIVRGWITGWTSGVIRSVSQPD